MAGYKPLSITGMETGLIQSRQEFILPNDAYPVLQNAYVWRERILRKGGYQLLGRLRRVFTDSDIGLSGASPWSFNIYSSVSPAIIGEPLAQIEPGSFTLIMSPTPSTGTITGYNNSTNCEVTCSAPHGLVQGDIVTISGVQVVDGSGPNFINGGPYTISVPSSTTFTINQDSEGWGVYKSGGTWLEEVGSSAELYDQGNGMLATAPASSIFGTINYTNGNVVITNAPSGDDTLINFNYFPGLPVMGLRTQEVINSANDRMIAFDQKYAYTFNSGSNGFQEFIPGTTWNAHNGTTAATDFFWSTNYWTSSSVVPGTMISLFGTNGQKLFWVTNNTGQFNATADPVRITDGTTWVNFFPGVAPWAQIDSGPTYLTNFLCMLPFRGRMVTFNTWEGLNAASATNFFNRIRWATIGNPFIPYGAGPPAKGSWRSDIRGQGGFLDIPTNEDIISVGFVRDNLVIYCERSTWQLRYTGRSIAPFVIERVNSELGAQSPFSAIQFDTSLLGIGDKGVVECDSFKSKRIDIKIPDLVFQFQNNTPGGSQSPGINPYFRIQGIRDFENRLAYWTYADSSSNVGASTKPVFPTNRLVYNFENDSWAIFTDSLTALGTYQPSLSRNWLNTKIPWIKCKFPWINQPAQVPLIVGGNQQGFVEILDQLTTNDISLFISAISADGTTPTLITCPNHNMTTGTIIEISGIPTGTPFATSLNSPKADGTLNVFFVLPQDTNSFILFQYDNQTMQFSTPKIDPLTTGYVGGGVINIRDNFSIQSKKFNFMDEGQNIQMGYLDILMAASESSNPGAISLNVYLDYDDVNASNQYPDNQINDVNVPTDNPDVFFNTVIPTTSSNLNNIVGTKFWQRVFCPTRANFLTLEYTLNNAQMNGIEQEQDVQIDAQVLWIRKAGRLTQI